MQDDNQSMAKTKESLIYLDSSISSGSLLEAFRVHVALPTVLDQSFTYLSPESIPEGCRLVVPFGRRSLVGISVEDAFGPPPSKNLDTKLKFVAERLDQEPLIPPQLMRLARWIASYYFHPLGEVLATMLPAHTKHQQKVQVHLSEMGQAHIGSQESLRDALLSYIFASKSQVGKDTFQKRLRDYFRVNPHETEKTWSLESLARQKLISIKKQDSFSSRSADPKKMDEPIPQVSNQALPLTPAQEIAYQQIQSHISSPILKPILLHGVTGSGKTEIYLQLIAQLFQQGKVPEDSWLKAPQVLVMVPEISLTPQMTSVFTQRFPNQVAVVHSGLSDKIRWQTLESVRTGHKRILIGPRSAVFSCMRNLRAILVDEEHDSSYKQASTPSYHGRDVAVVRGQMENIPVLLGSATPSLESYQNALSNRYHLVTLSERANARPMPEIRMVPFLGAALPRAKIQTTLPKSGFRHLNRALEPPVVTEEILSALHENFRQGRQAMVVANRRGYATFLLDTTRGDPVSCPQCSISLTLHRKNTLLLCHYCGHRLEVSKFLQNKDPADYLPLGSGSQKVEDFLTEALPGLKVARLDSDISAKQGALTELLDRFRRREIDILVGTQILAKGHDFANVALIVILDVDHQLRLPDFRAGERTFQLLVQAAGRSGRAEFPGFVLLQTDQTEHPIVQAALRHDYAAFLKHEMEFRQSLAYPPLRRIIAVEFNSESLPRLLKLESFCHQWLDEMVRLNASMASKVRILGPSIPPLERVSGRYRRVLLLSSIHMKTMRQLVTQLLSVVQRKDSQVRVKVDVDPQSLM